MSDLRIPTKASLLQGSADSEAVEKVNREFQVVVHQRRQRKAKPVVDKSDQKVEQPEMMDIKRARHDVIRFGATGLGVKEKKNAQISLAVKLGAKPPKGVPKSLKECHQERRAAKQLKDASEAAGLHAKPITNFHPNQLIATAQRRKRKRNDVQNNTIKDYGKVGRSSSKSR